MQSNYTVHKGNSIDVLKTLEENSIDSIITNPFYEIHSIHNAYNVELWKECLRVLKPGGHLLAFSGSRTYHRMTVAIEDAGFEIRDQIMWVYDSNFTKENIKEPNTLLEPSHEPICVARKSLVGTVAENVLRFGTGAINIDDCRIKTDEKLGRLNNSTSLFNHKNTNPWIDNSDGKGRFPSNFIHDGSDNVVKLFPSNSKGMSGGGKRKKKSEIMPSIQVKEDPKNEHLCRNDSGSAARFFYSIKMDKLDYDKNNYGFITKPIDLIRYLCRLVTPPNGIVLDPFMYLSFIDKATILEGFKFIGIDSITE